MVGDIETGGDLPSRSADAVPWAGQRFCILTAHRVVPQLDVPHDVRQATFCAFLDRVGPLHRFGTDLLGGDPAAGVALTFDDGSADHAWVGDELARRGIRGLFFLVSGLLGTPGFLSWEQARELVSRGHEVGSHGADHVPVRGMSPAQVREQVRSSKARLENELQAPVRFFAPPFGSGAPALAEALAEAGYRGARLTRWGVHRPGQGDPWWLPSVPLTEFTLRSRWPDRILAEGRIPPVVKAIRMGRAVLPEPLRVAARRLLPTSTSARSEG